MNASRALPTPETMVGHCCGCRRFPIALFKVPGIYRYRCAECFEQETGHRHVLDDRKARSEEHS